MPIHNFNECSSNGDLSYLKKNREDRVSDIDLQLCWLDILDEYFTLSDDKLAISMLRKQVKIIQLHSKLEVLTAFKICIEKGVKVDQQLKDYKLSKEFLNIQHSIVKNDLNRLINSLPTPTEAKNNSLEFDTTIAIINKNGYRIDRFTTVVSEFISIKKLIQQENLQNGRV